MTLDLPSTENNDTNVLSISDDKNIIYLSHNPHYDFDIESLRTGDLSLIYVFFIVTIKQFKNEEVLFLTHSYIPGIHRKTLYQVFNLFKTILLRTNKTIVLNNTHHHELQYLLATMETFFANYVPYFHIYDRQTDILYPFTSNLYRNTVKDQPDDRFTVLLKNNK